MPELPEVETVRRGLAPAMEGALLRKVELRRPDLRFPLPAGFAARLEGRRIEALGRRAKYLLADLKGGLVLVMHLGMSGSFRIERPDGTATPGLFHHPRSGTRLHDHVVFALERPEGESVSVVYNDPRRFGYMELIERAEMDRHPFFRDLGVEPTGNGLDGAALAPLFARRSAPLKAVLLDQSVIAGLGNIYVCEALWRAGLSPHRSAASLARADGRPTEWLDRLATHVRQTIADAIEAGGSTLRDYRQADGSLGYFQHRFAVYGQEGKPCPRPGCGGTIRRIAQSGRSTFFCPACQR